MAFLFTKRAGAPAGAIRISVAATTYLIDDVSNTIISEPDPALAAALSIHPYLLANGGTPGPYAPPKAGVSQELAYSESTSTILSTTSLSVATSVVPLSIAFTAGVRPVMVEFFIPSLLIGAGATGNVGICNTSNVAMGIGQYSPGSATNPDAPVVFRRRLSTPGVYAIKAFIYTTTAAGYIANADTGSGLVFAPMFLHAVEV